MQVGEGAYGLLQHGGIGKASTQFGSVWLDVEVSIRCCCGIFAVDGYGSRNSL